MSVSVPVYHYGILKGYLLAHGATGEHFAALEALYAAAISPPLATDLRDTLDKIMDAAGRVAAHAVPPPSPPIEIHGSPDVELPPLTRKALERVTGPAVRGVSESYAEREDAGEVVLEPSPQKPRRSRTPWSEEQKEAARVRMANARAAKAKNDAREPAAVGSEAALGEQLAPPV